MAIKEDIQSIIRGEAVDDEQTLARFSHDASLFEIRPQLAVTPRDSEDIKKIVSYVNGHAQEKLSLTVRSGATDMTGGTLGESIVLDLTKYFTRMSPIENRQVTVQPGIYYRDFEEETLKHNLLLPSFPASREICTVGGMVANNAGGEKTLTYGKTIDYVQRLKAVMADGREYIFGPLDRAGLDAKMAEDSFDGKLHKNIFGLIEKNYDLAQKARPNVSKNSAGYYLWDVWDRQTFDLTKLLTGSQGTLGIITEITFRLIRPNKYSQLLIIFLNDLKPLAQIIQSVLQHKPESFESFDDKTLKLALRFFPGLLKQMGARNLMSLGLQFLPEFWLFVTGGVPKLILLAEFTGYSSKEVADKARAAKRDLDSYNIKTHITKDKKEVRKYWTIRRESFNLLRHHIKNKQTAPFIDDMVVRPEYLPDFLPRLEEILRPYNLTYSIAGHAGDGDFHIIPLMDLRDPKTKEIIRELSKKVYSLILEFHGSITGEHNDGLIRSPFLKQMYGPEVYALFEEVKKIFDPHNIFNPGKKVNSSFEYAMEHLKRG